MEPPLTVTNMNELIAFARSRAPVNSVMMIATMTELETAPPRPWKKRAMINIDWDCARAHTNDDVVKIATPLRKTFFRPMRSPRRPASSKKLPKAIRYASTTQVRLDWVKWRSF